MPFVVRCKLCGTDHPYPVYSEGGDCQNEECGAELSPENVKIVTVLQSAKPADPLEEY